MKTLEANFSDQTHSNARVALCCVSHVVLSILDQNTYFVSFL